LAGPAGRRRSGTREVPDARLSLSSGEARPPAAPRVSATTTTRRFLDGEAVGMYMTVRARIRAVGCPRM